MPSSMRPNQYEYNQIGSHQIGREIVGEMIGETERERERVLVTN